jgi:hypothetical protein
MGLEQPEAVEWCCRLVSEHRRVRTNRRGQFIRKWIRDTEVGLTDHLWFLEELAALLRQPHIDFSWGCIWQNSASGRKIRTHLSAGFMTHS